jgi:hypothetical protein
MVGFLAGGGERTTAEERSAMTQIVLTAEQAAILTASNEPVAMCSPDGTIIGFVSPKSRFLTPKEPIFTPEEIAAAERQLDSDGPWYTTQQVLERLRSQQPQ